MFPLTYVPKILSKNQYFPKTVFNLCFNILMRMPFVKYIIAPIILSINIV